MVRKDLQNIRCLCVSSSESALGSRRQPEEDLLAAQEKPGGWDCLVPGLIQRQIQGRKADLLGGEGMKSLFLHQTLMKALTWAGGTGACQRAATRNQSSAFGWNKSIDGAEGRKSQSVAMWRVCLPATGY